MRAGFSCRTGAGKQRCSHMRCCRLTMKWRAYHLGPVCRLLLLLAQAVGGQGSSQSESCLLGSSSRPQWCRLWSGAQTAERCRCPLSRSRAPATPQPHLSPCMCLPTSTSTPCRSCPAQSLAQADLMKGQQQHPLNAKHGSRMKSYTSEGCIPPRHAKLLRYTPFCLCSA